MSPSLSSASEEEVNHFISEKERRELLSGEDSGSETNDDEDTELAAKKFAPSKETLKLLSSASSHTSL